MSKKITLIHSATFYCEYRYEDQMGGRESHSPELDVKPDM